MLLPTYLWQSLASLSLNGADSLDKLRNIESFVLIHPPDCKLFGGAIRDMAYAGPLYRFRPFSLRPFVLTHRVRLLKIAAAYGHRLGKVPLKTDAFLSIYEDMLDRESGVWFNDAVHEFGFVLVRNESTSICSGFRRWHRLRLLSTARAQPSSANRRALFLAVGVSHQLILDRSWWCTLFSLPLCAHQYRSCCA